MRFDEQLTAMRKAKGLNQEQLAEKVGVSRQAVSKWETGDAQPDFAKLLALADALEIDLDTLCCREAPKATASTAPNAKPKRKWLRAVLAALLSAALFALGIFTGTKPAKPNTQTNVHTSTVTVAGVKFTRMAEVGKVNYRFVPSIAGEGCTYTLTLCDGDGEEHFSVTCKDGKCAGILQLEDGKEYTAAVTIRKENINYLIPIAKSLKLNKNTVVWE